MRGVSPPPPSRTATSDATFSPNQSCTRAQIVTFLWRAMGEPVPAGAETPFADVSEDAWYYHAVLWAVENRITDGVDETHFAPNGVSTRAEAVTFLYRAAGSPVPAQTDEPFTDVPEDAWYRNAVLWAVELGITTGTSSVRFSPSRLCTRAQTVTFLYRLSRYLED